ncbi:unnamed protein product [Lymnaea stagnalis]|uniref:Uncharacterized protein n=1 Tax=Lymnaea stagnalis TaxID=6523 RepID=A0AAV2I460_LYMST
MKLQAFLLIIALVVTNLDVKYAQEISYFKLVTKECSTKCKSGYLKLFDSCTFNFEISFKETLPDVSSLNFELMEDSSNIYNHILTLDMKSDCEGYKENSDVYCTELDMNVFRITIKAKELSRYSEANVRVYITTPNKPNIFGDIQKFPRFYDSTDAIGRLRVNGMSIPSEMYCNATIKGNKLNINFDCTSPAIPCWIQIKINENIVVEEIENQVVWNETFKSSLALNLSIKFSACRLDGNSNYINCLFQSEFLHSEVDNSSKTPMILGISITVCVLCILFVVFMVYW